MVQELYDKYIFLYIMGSLCVIGVLLKCFLLVVYNKLIRASESMATTKKAWMKHMKSRFENAYHQRVGVNDVDIFVDKYVSKTKYGGLLLSTWENLSGQIISLCILTGSFAGILGIVYDCGKGPILFTFFMGAWTAVIVNIVDNIVNISGHRQVLRYNLKDYFENYLKVKMEQTVYNRETAGNHTESMDLWQEEIPNQHEIPMTRKQKKEKAKMDALLAKMDKKKEKEEKKKLKEERKLDEQAKKMKEQSEAIRRKEEAAAAKEKLREEEREARLKDKQDAKQAKLDEKQAKLDAKQAKIKAKEDAREDHRLAKEQEKEAKQQAKLDAVKAREQEKEEARRALEESKKAMLEAKQAKAEEKKANKKSQAVSQKAQIEKMRLMQDKERVTVNEDKNRVKTEQAGMTLPKMKEKPVHDAECDPEDIDEFEPIEMVATSKEDDALIEEVLRDFLS